MKMNPCALKQVQSEQEIFADRRLEFRVFKDLCFHHEMNVP
jgi:hypothetical protein